MNRVYIKDTDVSKYVYNIPNINQKIDRYGSLMVINDITITGDKEFWNVNNPKSPLYKVDYQFMEMKIIDDDTNVEIYKGLLRDINIVNESASIIITNRFDTIMNTYIPYYFCDMMTPAEIIEDILVQNNINFNATDMPRAIDIQNQAGLQVTAQVTPSNNITIGGLITQLCKASMSILGFVNNQARLFQYNPDEEPIISYTITDKDIFNIAIKKESNTPFNGYRVIYSINQMTQENSNMYQDINLGEDQIITLYNPSGALWLGENLIAYNNKLKESIELEVINELVILQLGGHIELDTEEYGKFVYRIVGLDKSDISIKLNLEYADD